MPTQGSPKVKSIRSGSGLPRALGKISWGNPKDPNVIASANIRARTIPLTFLYDIEALLKIYQIIEIAQALELRVCLLWGS
jgi:hypothetical protein